MKHDFSGISTAYEVKCGDGRTIAKGAFDHQDQTAAPLVWRHQHQDMQNVLGHGVLLASEDGMRYQAKFNNSPNGRHAKQLVKDGDIRYLSIYANRLKVDDRDPNRVVHGMIREVSLVLAGENPGAVIEDVIIHGDGFEPDVIEQDAYIIHSGIPIELLHEEEEKPPAKEEPKSKEEDLGDILATFDQNQEVLFSTLLHAAASGSGKLDPEEAVEKDGPTLEQVYESMDEKQKNTLHLLLGEALEEPEPEEVQHEAGDDIPMKHNIFEQKGNREVAEDGVETLSHDAFTTIVGDAITNKASSLRGAIKHAGTYGIDNIPTVLFPDAKDVRSGGPMWYSEDMGWVTKVLNPANKTRFSRIKSRYADITADEARAKGYVTGDEKTEEVFPVFARVTTPQTVYKKQKLDRDDIVDITDFDVVRWMKMEMQVKLREEIARAILIGDGRLISDDDKINPANIRPIYGDDAIYTHVHTAFASDATALDIVDGFVAARTNYKGAGSPTLFCTSELLTSLLLVRDTTNRRIHDNEQALARALRVSNIVEVPFMTGVSRTDGSTYNLLGIVVNMRDYTIGADKGGATTFFQDFDIDFNQYKYLYETRMSGALVVPKAAIVFEQLAA